jgi:hypothetical protein
VRTSLEGAPGEISLWTIVTHLLVYVQTQTQTLPLKTGWLYTIVSMF